MSRATVEHIIQALEYVIDSHKNQKLRETAFSVDGLLLGATPRDH